MGWKQSCSVLSIVQAIGDGVRVQVHTLTQEEVVSSPHPPITRCVFGVPMGAGGSKQRCGHITLALGGGCSPFEQSGRQMGTVSFVET